MTDLGSLPPDDRMMVEGLYWWGVPSLFRCPVDADPAACDLALVGVPHASGNASTERDQLAALASARGHAPVDDPTPRRRTRWRSLSLPRRLARVPRPDGTLAPR